MKQYIFSLGLGLLALTTVGCDDFLDQYSQDLVVAKSVTDLNELLVGDVYLRSHEVSKGMNAGVYGFVNALDDDINTTGTSQQGNIANTAWTNTLAPLFVARQPLRKTLSRGFGLDRSLRAPQAHAAR